MDPGDWSGLPRPRFGRRLLVVSGTWLLLAFLASRTNPVLPLAAGIITVGVAGRAVWKARRQATWNEPSRLLRRQLLSAAVVLASGFVLATVLSLETALPSWVYGLQGGALLHYWLLGLAED